MPGMFQKQQEIQCSWNKVSKGESVGVEACSRRALLDIEDFSLYSEYDGEPVEGFEQRSSIGSFSRNLWLLC